MYYILYGFFWLLSILPMRVLYFIADCFYALIFYVFKYRRDVVYKNLAQAFPEKTEKERVRIAKDFYHNLIDTFVETIKMVTMSRKFIEKRFTANWEVVNNLKASGKRIQLHLGHNFNWEWGNAVGTHKLAYKFLAVYMPFANKAVDKFFYKLRTRHGTVMMSATKMAEEFVPYRNTQYMLGLVADQSPGHPGNGWWFNFFGKPTPFVKGPARGAIINDTVVVFAFIHKPRRGYYDAVFSVVTTEPQLKTEVELTAEFVRYLEDVVRQYPDMWLWSHRRWKHEWKPEYGPINEIN